MGLFLVEICIKLRCGLEIVNAHCFHCITKSMKYNELLSHSLTFLYFVVDN